MKIKTEFLNFILKTLIAKNKYFLLSLLIRLTSKKLLKNKSNKKVLYYIPKTAFIDDLNSIFNNINHDIEVRSFNRQVFLFICDIYFKKGRNEYNFVNIELKKEEEKIRQNLLKFIKLYKKLFQVDGFITCAYNYCEQRDLAKICHDLGIKFIALHKECITTDLTRLVRSKIYKEQVGDFFGTLLLTYNEDEMKSIPFNSINKKVVGSPRTDIYFKNNTVKQDIDLLFLTFSKYSYLPRYRGKLIWPYRSKSIDFERILRKSISWVIKFSKENLDKKIVIKSKVGFSIKNYLQEEDWEFLNNHKNIEILETGTAKDLLAKSKIVFGFNTTSIIEAIALDKVLITPLDDMIESKLFKLCSLKLSNCNIEVSDYSNFKNKVMKHKDGYSNKILVSNTYQDQKSNVLKKYLGFSDGMSGQRVYKEIRDELFK